MGTEITRTRGVRLVADGIAGTPGGRVWGFLNNGVAAGTFQLRDGTVTGTILWDGTLAIGQWIPLIAPIRCPTAAFIDIGTITDITVHVDY